MGTTRAATTHDKQKNPKPTGQMSQGQTLGQRQPEHVSESSPPLHRYLGNSYVQAMTTKTQRPGLQTKLTVNEPGDIYEQEADRAADQVMAAQTHANISSAPLQIQRFSDSSYGQGDAAPASVAQTLTSPGRPMEPALRQDMEQRFGYDFSKVRVHTGAAAEQSARDVHARAYTMGHHMVFGAGRLAPETTEGRRLIAHELTHVAQTSARDSHPSRTAALRLPILRQSESAGAAEEQRRRVRASLAVLDSTPMLLPLTGDVPAAIQWAEKQQSKFEDPDFTEEERTYIARGLLRAFEQLRELEGKGERDPDGALVYLRGMSDPKPWTQDRAHKLDDIAPFTAANIAAWREAEAWQAPVTSRAKQPPKKKPPPQKQPAEVPERRGFGMNVTFPKQEGMTFNTEEGQQRIAFFLIRSTRSESEYTNDQIAWAVSRIDLSKWWAPPGKLDLPTWRENFEATAIGDKVTMGLSKKFEAELAKVLLDVPSQHAFRIEHSRQAVLSAAPTTYLAYAAPAGLMAGTIIGSGLAFLPAAGTVGGGGLTTGGGGLLAGGEGSLLLGGTIRQSALYAGRYFYLNAPRLYANAMLYSGAITSGVALAEHLREVRSRGVRTSDLPRLAEDLFPFFFGYSEWRSFRGGGPQSPREGPPVAGPKPVPAKVPATTPPPTPVGTVATGSRIPPISRPVDVTHRDRFNAPLVTPTAPAPVRPVTRPVATGRTVEQPVPVAPTPPGRSSVAPPSRLQAWLRSKIVEYALRGAEASDVTPRFGAGGAPPNARPTATEIVKTTPARVVPTPDLRTPTPRPSVSPAGIVTPSTPSHATGSAVRTAAPAPAAPGATTAPSAGAVAISQMIDEATAGLPHPGSRPLDPSRMRAAVLSPETQAHARQQWDNALFPLAQRRTPGMIPSIDVEGVRFHEVEVSWNGSELRVGYFGIERTTAPGGAGEEIHEALERAAIQVAQRAGASSVRVFARTVVNDRWRETLNAHGYNVHMMAHEHGFANVQARLFPIARQTGGRVAPAASVTTLSPTAPRPGSTPHAPTSSGSTLPRSRASSVTPLGTTTRVEHATLSGTAPSQAPAVPVSTFIPPGPVRVLYRQDYDDTKITKGANQGKLLLTHKTTGQQFLFKPRSGEREIIGSEVGIRAGERYRRAPAAAYLAREAGIRTPAAEIVIWNDNGIEEIGSLQEWITEGQPASRFYLHPRVYNAMAASQPKLDLDAFDYVIANMDRNPGNWKVIIDPQTNAVREVLPIDMDASLPPGPGRYSLGYVLEHYQQPMPATITRGLYNRLLRMQADRSRIEIALREFLEQVVIDGVFTRLNELLDSVRTGNIDVVP
jgi:uncharacterized protein DUF4157